MENIEELKKNSTLAFNTSSNANTPEISTALQISSASPQEVTEEFNNASVNLGSTNLEHVFIPPLYTEIDTRTEIDNIKTQGIGDWIPDYLNINLTSYHAKGQNYMSRDGDVNPYNNKNLGLGLGWDLTEKSRTEVGFFENSYYKTSVYALYEHDFFNITDYITVSGFAGITTGYKDQLDEKSNIAKFVDETGIMPLAGLKASWHFDEDWAANITIWPGGTTGEEKTCYDRNDQPHNLTDPPFITGFNITGRF